MVSGLLLVGCIASSASIDRPSEEKGDAETNDEQDERQLESLEDIEAAALQQADDQIASGDLKVLPPIILLDFEDSNSTTDEKSKRTVNGNLGYGYNRNELLSGKYNFYFPAGDSGTTVSIEESVMPVQPKTIIEHVRPTTESPHAEPLVVYRKPGLDDQAQKHRQQTNNPPVFGQRTKLVKANSASFDSYHEVYHTTPKPGHYSHSNQHFKFSTSTARPAYNIYEDNYEQQQPMKPAYSQEYNNPGVQYTTPKYSQELTTPSPYYGNSYKTAPADYSASQSRQPIYYSPETGSSLKDYPKYTVENGIRYQHKIVWKYPDGKISESPPPSYSGSYNEAPATKYRPDNYQASNTYQTLPANLMQGPVQFANAQAYQRPPPPANRFAQNLGSAASQLSTRYQPDYGMKYAKGQQPSAASTSYKMSKRPSSKYAVDSSNADYVHADKAINSKGLLTSSGELSPQVLSKYTPQVQSYLAKVFSNMQNQQMTQNHPSNHQSNFLSYNPSISQYIKNPSSILNAQPTFIQAGDSLIPVVILRVDGAAPIQRQSTPNINLKALLQKYLTQYASSISELQHNQNYEFGEEDSSGAAIRQPAPVHNNPIDDLAELTQTLSRYSQNPQTFANGFATTKLNNQRQPLMQHHTGKYPIAYSTRANNYGEPLKSEEPKPTATHKLMRQKVKNVQIIEDPRYPPLASS